MDQHAVWEAIAASFDRSRTRTWDHVVEFLEACTPGQRVLDLMCGNGRHIPPAVQRRLDVVGVDWSRPLSRIVATRHGVPVVVADAARLPLRDHSFAAAVFVAGLHSIPEPADRAASLQELHRVLRPGGVAQITVWSRHARRFAALEPPPGPADVVVPWRSGGLDEARTYHLYTPESLQEAVVEAGFEVEAQDEVAIASERPDNLVVVLRRP